MSQGSTKPRIILVVDDDPDMRFYIRSCLLAGPATATRVVEAADGVEALTLARAGVADVVITDIVLPRLDGYGVCRGIKQDAALRHIPVLLISGKQSGATAGGMAGGDGFLSKPFNARQLRDALERATMGPSHGAAADPA